MTPLATVTPVLTMTGIHKRFGGVHALRGAHMSIEKPGVVHALVGANGSGKSTMLNILSGQLRPDEGVIKLDGRTVTFRGPVASLEHGIAMVSQESALATDLTIAENILLGRRLVRRRLGIDWSATKARASEVLQQVGVDYDPATIVRSLRPDQKQMVEIARALSTDARIIVLDEPTSSLTEVETEGLFAAIRRLKERDVCVLYVSHRLPELFEMADEVTVLRDGVTVAGDILKHFTPRSLVAAMTGEESSCAVSRRHRSGARMTSVLEINDLCVLRSLFDVSLKVGEGEIVGLAGLVGSGRGELLEAIYGLCSPSSGTISVSGRPLKTGSPRTAAKHGIGFVPPDRKSQGLVLNNSVRENLAMAKTSSRGWLRNPRTRTVNDDCTLMSKRLEIKATLNVEAKTLSGGNQQKVVLGKWLLHTPRVLLLDEPTRGVDVRSKAEIHCHLRRAADEGMAILVSSSEYDELLEICDRIIVLFRGRVIRELASNEATEMKLAELAGGVRGVE